MKKLPPRKIQDAAILLHICGKAWIQHQQKKLWDQNICFHALRATKRRMCSLWEQILSLRRSPYFETILNTWKATSCMENVLTLQNGSHIFQIYPFMWMAYWKSMPFQHRLLFLKLFLFWHPTSGIKFLSARADHLSDGPWCIGINKQEVTKWSPLLKWLKL